MDNQRLDTWKSGFDAGYSRSTTMANNPFYSTPNSYAWYDWKEGYIAGDKQRQILTDKIA